MIIIFLKNKWTYKICFQIINSGAGPVARGQHRSWHYNKLLILFGRAYRFMEFYIGHYLHTCACADVSGYRFYHTAIH